MTEKTRTDRAVQRYLREDLTVARGAELAGVTMQEFEETLIEHGVEPRYGPDSVEELHSGPELDAPGGEEP